MNCWLQDTLKPPRLPSDGRSKRSLSNKEFAWQWAFENWASQIALFSNDVSPGRDAPMNISIKLDNEARQTYAVFVDGVCIARTLPMAEANRVRMQALNGELGKPRLS